MSVESEKFSLSDVDWIYTASREITRDPKPPVKTGIKAVSALCKSCGHAWRARQHGEGKLLGTLGGVIVTCPVCGTDDHVKGSVFQQAGAV